MVRIQRRIAKKPYLNSKHVYSNTRVDLPIPKKFHKAIEPFPKLDLEMQLVVKNRKISIVKKRKTAKETSTFQKGVCS
jgi:hypothetical protein